MVVDIRTELALEGDEVQGMLILSMPGSVGESHDECLQIAFESAMLRSIECDCAVFERGCNAGVLCKYTSISYSMFSRKHPICSRTGLVRSWIRIPKSSIHSSYHCSCIRANAFSCPMPFPRSHRVKRPTDAYMPKRLSMNKR